MTIQNAAKLALVVGLPIGYLAGSVTVGGLILEVADVASLAAFGALVGRQLLDLLVTFASSERSRLKPAPGARLISLTSFLCRASSTALVDQMVADLRTEYFEALKQGRPHKARWLVVLHYIAIARALTVDRILDRVANYVLGVARAGK